MVTRITSPPFSFVRFSDQHLDDADWLDNQIPGSELGMILPVNSNTDLAFQFIVETDTIADADELCNIANNQYGIFLVPGSDLPGVLTSAELLAIQGRGDVIYDDAFNLGIGTFRISDTSIMYFIPRLPAMTGMACGQCFQIVFALSALTDYGQRASNVFIYNCNDTDFTTVIDYYSERDEAGFMYCLGPDIKNRVRLPIYLTRPTFPETEDVLTLSDGQRVIRKSDVRKLYEIVTDGMPNWIVESLRAVFIHDNVFTDVAPDVPQTLPYIGEIAKDGSFEPQYVDYKNYPLAIVAFKVNALEYKLSKNNCGLCGDYSSFYTVIDTSVNIAPSTIYNVELTALVDEQCCDPFTFSIDYFQTNYIQTANIVVNGPGQITLGFGTKSSLTADPLQHPPPLFRIKTVCGGVIKYINIFSNMA